MTHFIVALEISRFQCIGPLIRCAVAFGAKMIIIIGSNKYTTFGCHGSNKHIGIVIIKSS